MESIAQIEAPKISIVEMQKKEAGDFVAKRLNELMSEGGSLLSSARQVYEEVQGQDYRREQASAKLLEFLSLQNEVDLRAKELTHAYSSFAHFTNDEPANDAKYLIG